MEIQLKIQKVMKRINKIVTLVFLLFLGFSGSSFGQVTADASVSVNIVTPIAIVKAADMNFGNVAVSASVAGTVVLPPSGPRTTGGAGGVTLPANIGTVSAASFTVSGQANYSYAITLPSSVSITDGTHTMTVNTFTSSPATTGTLSAGGSQTLTVGATLNVTAGQAAGTYTNATGVSVTVNYN